VRVIESCFPSKSHELSIESIITSIFLGSSKAPLDKPSISSSLAHYKNHKPRIYDSKTNLIKENSEEYILAVLPSKTNTASKWSSVTAKQGTATLLRTVALNEVSFSLLEIQADKLQALESSIETLSMILSTTALHPSQNKSKSHPPLPV
jgi:hypothetical protein